MTGFQSNHTTGGHFDIFKLNGGSNMTFTMDFLHKIESNRFKIFFKFFLAIKISFHIKKNCEIFAL